MERLIEILEKEKARMTEKEYIEYIKTLLEAAEKCIDAESKQDNKTEE